MPSSTPVTVEPPSGWAVAGTLIGKTLYWLTIGVLVVAGAALVAFLAIVISGSSDKRKRL